MDGILENPVMTSKIVNRFNKIGDATELVSITETTFKSLMLKMLSRFMKKSFQKRQDGDLWKLKEVIEGMPR